MCGIAGFVALRDGAAAAGARGRSRRWSARCATAGPTSSGSTATRRAGARPRAALHHRPGHRAAAALQRGRHALGRLQRRDLQLRRAARRARRARPPLPHPQRHRGHRPRLRGLGRAAPSSASTASSRSRSGTRAARRWSWRATGSGVRPLYLCEHGGRLWFASEVKAIFAGRPRHPARARPGRARRDLHLLDRGAAAVGVPRRHRARARPRADRLARRAPTDRAFWAPALPGRRRGRRSAGSLDEAAERVREALEQAVRLRMLRADVPVGSYLSGGLDSSLVAALGRRVKGERFCTFSLRFEDAEYDETPFQRAMAARIGSDHREIVVRRRGHRRGLPGGGRRTPSGPSCAPRRRRCSCSRGWCATRASRWCSPARAPTRCSPATTCSARPRCGASGAGSPPRRCARACWSGSTRTWPARRWPSGPWRGSSSAGAGSGGPSRASPTRRAGRRPRRCSGSSPPTCAREAQGVDVVGAAPGARCRGDSGAGRPSRRTSTSRCARCSPATCSPRRATAC